MAGRFRSGEGDANRGPDRVHSALGGGYLRVHEADRGVAVPLGEHRRESRHQIVRCAATDRDNILIVHAFASDTLDRAGAAMVPRASSHTINVTLAT